MTSTDYERRKAIANWLFHWLRRSRIHVYDQFADGDGWNSAGLCSNFETDIGHRPFFSNFCISFLFAVNSILVSSSVTGLIFSLARSASGNCAANFFSAWRTLTLRRPSIASVFCWIFNGFFNFACLLPNRARARTPEFPKNARRMRKIRNEQNVVKPLRNGNLTLADLIFRKIQKSNLPIDVAARTMGQLPRFNRRLTRFFIGDGQNGFIAPFDLEALSIKLDQGARCEHEPGILRLGFVKSAYFLARQLRRLTIKNRIKTAERTHDRKTPAEIDEKLRPHHAHAKNDNRAWIPPCPKSGAQTKSEGHHENKIHWTGVFLSINPALSFAKSAVAIVFGVEPSSHNSILPKRHFLRRRVLLQWNKGGGA